MAVELKPGGLPLGDRPSRMEAFHGQRERVGQRKEPRVRGAPHEDGTLVEPPPHPDESLSLTPGSMGTVAFVVNEPH